MIRDAYPISPGHSLIVPKRHIASWFDLTEEESSRLFQQLSKAKTAFDAEFKPAGFNIGINEGAARLSKLPNYSHIMMSRFMD